MDPGSSRYKLSGSEDDQICGVFLRHFEDDLRADGDAEHWLGDVRTNCPAAQATAAEGQLREAQARKREKHAAEEKSRQADASASEGQLREAQARKREEVVAEEAQRQEKQRIAEGTRRAEEARRADEADHREWTASGADGCRVPASLTACDAVRTYLNAHRTGSHVAEATQALKDAEPRLATLQDEADWDEAIGDMMGDSLPAIYENINSCRSPWRSDGCATIQRYLDRHSSGAHAAEAQSIIKASASKIASLRKQEEKALAKAKEADERREALETARSKLVLLLESGGSAVSADDLRNARNIVEKEPGLLKMLVDDEGVRALLYQNISGPTLQLVQGGSGADLRNRVCQARLLMQRVLGQQGWKKFLGEVATQFRGNPDASKRAFAILNSGNCR